MSREKTLFIIGIIVMVLPQLGFSNLTEKIIFLALGIMIILISYTLYFDKVKKPKPVTKRVVREKTAPEPTREVSPKEELTGFTYVRKDPVAGEDLDVFAK